MAYFSQENKKQLAPRIKKILANYGLNGFLSVNNHSTFVLTIKSGKVDFFADVMETCHWGVRKTKEENVQSARNDGYHNVNIYHIDSHYEGLSEKILTELHAAMRGDIWYDNSDAMVDYFDTAFYTDINIGKWDKPYQLTA